ncbi:MAG TPA: methylmalonyl-CoA mutase family protein, partial [Gaiellaceae bacterium]|nr:methylmalonyl-CoA mutase family protein [Gaiellaceae bacterium]
MATTEDPRADVGAPPSRNEGWDDTATAKWRRELYDASPEREGELFTTISGNEVDPLYTPDSGEVDYDRDLGYPGTHPFTRGVYPSMYRGKLWTMRQFAGFGTAEETNARFRYLLDHGQTGLSTAFDMPTLMGYDSDHARSLGEVGREGVAVDSLADMETLFDGIPLGEVSTSMTINSPAAMLLAFYAVVGEEQGVLFSTIGGIENEPLYTPENVDVDYDRDLGYPGVHPFTRGAYPSMYRGKLWTMRQFAGFGTAAETNERFRYLLEHGQTGLSTAFDMPTLMGYDSDHPRSLGEVGREGVAVDSLADMETLFSGIPLADVSTSMTINGP